MFNRRDGASVVTVLLAVSVLFGAACTGGSDAADAPEDGTAASEATTEVQPSGPAQFLADDTLTVCVDAPKYPFAFQSPAGEWLGSDIEVLEHIADDLDRTLAVVDTPFAGIWQRPAGGECDLAAAAITVTDARRAEASFSNSYLSASQSVLVRAEDAEAFATLAGLAGEPIGVKGGTTSEEYVRANLPTGARIVTYEETEAMFLALGARDISAVVSDLPLNGYRSTLDSNVAVTEVIDTGEVYGIAAASTNAGLTAEVNDILDDYLESDDYRNLLSRWFGVR